MAARIDPAQNAPIPDLLDLRRLSPRDLDDLLEEEIETWRESLDWDFSKSADLVRRFVGLHALNGCALVLEDEVLGYAYFVLEEHKGLIGDLYVRHAIRSVENENRLLESVLRSLMETPYVSRIESQLMMIASHRERLVPSPRFLRTFERNFMVLDLERASLGDPTRRDLYVQRWSEQYQEGAANLIADAYLGHIDGHINDQYRSVAGARRFLFNIVQYPGCGTFFKPASYVAFDRETGRLCGICLASLVARDCGHITQICTSSWARGTGVGYELLRRSLATLREFGCRKTSLTVTAANHEAVQLYERVGFVTQRKFSAYLWEGF